MRANNVAGVTCGLALACAVAGPAPAADAKKITVGIVEAVRLDPGNLTLDAKIDTGADESSLDARDIQLFDRNGERWVRFTVPLRRGPRTLELPFVRMMEIKRANAPSAERPVVRMIVCLSDIAVEANVNLTDRSGLTYRMLIGRSILSGRTVVDPQHEHLTKPRCKGLAP